MKGGRAIDSSGVLRGNVRIASGTVAVVDAPVAVMRFDIFGAQSISPADIDGNRDIAGTYTENNLGHGFVRKP